MLICELLVIVAAPAFAQGTLQFSVHPTGAEEVPPNASVNFANPGSFTHSGTTLSYRFSVALNSPLSISSATINGPAPIGVTGPVLFDLGAPTALPPLPPYWSFLFQGSIEGLSGTQVSDLSAGLWYVNVFGDVSFPEGQFRGQILLVPEPASPALLGLAGLAGLVWHRRKR